MRERFIDSHKMSKSVVISTSQDNSYDFKAWKQCKAQIENLLIENLKSSVRSGFVQEFESFLSDGSNVLERLYSELPPEKSSNDDSQLQRNKKLRMFFGEMCKSDTESNFLIKFLEQIPIINEAIQQMYNQYPLHIAISSRAFANVETLLNVPDVNVNVLWKKQTPLMLLFKMTNTENFPLIEKIVKLLASKQADINIGDYTRHPLSVVCQLTSISDAQKHQLLALCVNLFKCDVDSLTKSDIAALIPDFQIEQKRAEVTLEMMKSLLLADNEPQFIDELDGFIQKRNGSTSELAELLMLAASKGRSECVESIFISSGTNSDELIEQSNKLSKVLKIVCTKGYPEVLELLLTYIAHPAVFNAKPLALTCLQRLYRDRTADLERCFDMLLSDPRISMQTSDRNGRTALDFARHHKMDEEVLKIIDNELRSQAAV